MALVSSKCLLKIQAVDFCQYSLSGSWLYRYCRYSPTLSLVASLLKRTSHMGR